MESFRLIQLLSAPPGLESRYRDQDGSVIAEPVLLLALASDKDGGSRIVSFSTPDHLDMPDELLSNYIGLAMRGEKCGLE
jgi:hypothetical protein